MLDVSSSFSKRVLRLPGPNAEALLRKVRPASFPSYGSSQTAIDTLTVYNWFVDNLGMGKPSDLVQGTLDLLILKTISLEPMHGWAIAKRIQQMSGEVLQVQQGSLYPALHRLEQQGWIKAKWEESETGRQAKFYSLTGAGRAQMEKETANWSRLSTAINLIVSEA
jgi:PadR family transcriptional regulator, regulatory protein PadR